MMFVMDQNQFQPQPQPYPYPAAPPPVDAPVSWDPLAPDGRPLAGAGQRFGARVVDGILTVVLVFIPFVVAIPLASLLPDDSPAIPVIMIATAVLAFLGMPYLYEVEYPLRRGGQTPGKQLIKIAVTPLEPGAPLTRGVLVKRWLLITGFNILAQCYVGLIDPLWLLWDKPYKQCLHDKWPRTCVIQLGPAR